MSAATFLPLSVLFATLEVTNLTATNNVVGVNVSGDDLNAVDDLTVGDDTTMSGDLAVVGNYTSAAGSVTLTLGTLTAEQVTSSDDMLVTDDLTVGGDVAVTGTVTGTGGGSFPAGLTTGGNLAVVGNSNLSGNLTVAGITDIGDGAGDKVTFHGASAQTGAQSAFIAAPGTPGAAYVEAEAVATNNAVLALRTCLINHGLMAAS